MGIAERARHLVTGRRSAWVVLLVAVVLSGLALGLRGEAPSSGDPTSGLPASAESARAAALQRELPSGQLDPAVVVYARGGDPLTAQDRAAAAQDAGELRALAVGGALPPPLPSEDGTALVLTVPLQADRDSERVARVVEEVREVVRAGLPDGLSAQVTGGAAFTTDLAGVFDGADVTLLGATVVVVALLLLVTYRSPFLWLVPLLVVAVGDQVAASLLTIVARASGTPLDPSTEGISSILVFGAGTNYALLLIARYREELRRTEDRRQAMRDALTGAGPAVLASAGTVVLSLLCLLAASLTFNRDIGLAGALGITVALVYALVVLPAALVVLPRGVFWPFVPRVGQGDRALHGPWARVGAAVARRPVAVVLLSALAVAVLAAGTLGVRVGLSQTEQFRERVEAVEGQETLARSFSAGASQPLSVVAPVADADAVAAAALEVPGVSDARVTERAEDLAAVQVVVDAAAGTDASDAAIEGLRERLDDVGGGTALVGGPVATEHDTREAAARDRLVVIPLVLVVVLAVLAVLLRALVAPVVLVATVVATYFAALGASALIVTRWFGDPALDANVPLVGFLFLVALGVDYNIFLTTRAREEAPRVGTRRGVLVALAVTGGVITSAGVLLAAVFAVLGVLPLILLGQLGVLVGLGVLLDTLLVRSLVVPALVLLLGPRFWWPSRLAREAEPERREPVRAGAG
ncbi:MMPL family transporter [Vallicoccus soli]|uniref:MMPL family transporter n=1 Tax=Vallicoccus soli TaxID=2339232 RepID=A0A3A3Z1N5_9ACTN|nr:MMPL family transporter [Vallicoccus soli]RJK95388.1 MMPL family transporter [Vallicoccus soli]